jgi:hypothetical protein
MMTDYWAFIERDPVWNRLVEESGSDHQFVRDERARAVWDCFSHGVMFNFAKVRARSRLVSLR